MAMRSITTADLQLQAAICSGGRWWSHAGRPHDDPLAISAPFSCSSADPNSGSAITAGGHFNWAACHGAPVDAMVAAEPVRACEVWPGSNSTTTYQDFEYAGGAYGSMAMAEVLDVNSLQVLDCELSSPTIFNWSRPFLSTPSADETGVHGVIQEDMYSSRTYCQQESDQMHNKIRSTNTVHLLEDHRALSSSTDWDSVLFPASAAHEQVDESLQPSFVETPQLTTAKQPSQQGQFTDGDTLFWNPSGTEACSIQMHHSELTHELLQNNIKVNSVSKKCSSTSLEDSEPALKKPRIQTPSPLPTFKVRKEKLGDRITALQQLVSPFGKTDTASVLHEAIDYIKFLHDQVQVLSSSNSKANIQMQQAIKRVRTSEDLRSRGLCLVPISSTIQMVARETPVDFWPLGFGAAPS